MLFSPRVTWLLPYPQSQGDNHEKLHGSSQVFCQSGKPYSFYLGRSQALEDPMGHAFNCIGALCEGLEMIYACRVRNLFT